MSIVYDSPNNFPPGLSKTIVYDSPANILANVGATNGVSISSFTGTSLINSSLTAATGTATGNSFSGIISPTSTITVSIKNNESSDGPVTANNIFNLISYKQGGCLLIENFYSEKESSDLYNKIISSCIFETKNISVYGKLLPMPRKITYFGVNDYVYSGAIHHKQPIPEFITEIINDFINFEPISKYIKKENTSLLNSCLINYYQDGDDYIHFHSDDEKELGPDNEKNILVFSLSLGDEREFVIKGKPKCGPKMELKTTLKNGSLLITYGDFQHKFIHSLLKSKEKCNGRINLTFRYIMK